MISFEQASYNGQVRRLRTLAMRALNEYELEVESCRLVNHGENTTFQITDSRGRKFLLRIHRPGYHTRPAILEELGWLQSLAAGDLLKTPKPVETKDGQFVVSVGGIGIPEPRHCCMFEWIDGRFMRRSFTVPRLHALGRVIANLQRSAKGIAIAERRYWDAEGLVGTTPKFGSIDGLPDVSRENQKIITKARRSVLRKLHQFQHAFPSKQGLIHADVHFGNILIAEDDIAVIDFDDCGLGFHAYDLAVPITAVEFSLKRKREIPRFRDALIDGYAAETGWDKDDAAILPQLIMARKLLMLGWLHSRRDNPVIRKYFRRAVTRTMGYIEKAKLT